MSIRRIFNKGYALLRRAKIGRQNFERGVSLDVDFDHVGRRQLLIIQPDAIHGSGSVFTNSRTLPSSRKAYRVLESETAAAITLILF